IIALAIAPNDKQLAMSCKSQNLFIWNLDKKKKYRIQHLTSPAISMDYDATSSFIAFGCGDHSVRTYDVENNFITHHLKVYTGRVSFVKFHPYNFTLYTCALDGIKMWDLKKKICVTTFSNQVGEVTSLAFTPNGKFMISCSRDATFFVYDIERKLLVNS